MSLSKFLRSQSEGQGERLLLIKLDKLVQILLITLYVIKKKKKTASLICRYSGARLQVHTQQSFGNEPPLLHPQMNPQWRPLAEYSHE
jgi:hypothetical protein